MGRRSAVSEPAWICRELEKVAHEGSELVHFLRTVLVVAGYGLRVVHHTVQRLHHRLDASQGRAEVMESQATSSRRLVSA